MSGSSCHLGLATRLLIVWTYLHRVVWKTSNSRKKPCVPLLLPEVAVSMPFAATLQLLPHVATPLLDPTEGQCRSLTPGWEAGGPTRRCQACTSPTPGLGSRVAHNRHRRHPPSTARPTVLVTKSPPARGATRPPSPEKEQEAKEGQGGARSCCLPKCREAPPCWGRAGAGGRCRRRPEEAFCGNV